MVAARELGRYGVRVNAIAPRARTRLTAGPGGALAARGGRTSSTHGPGQRVAVRHLPGHRGVPDHGRVVLRVRRQVQLFQPWALIDKVEAEGRWTVEDLEIQAAKFADVPFQLGNPFGG